MRYKKFIVRKTRKKWLFIAPLILIAAVFLSWVYNGIRKNSENITVCHISGGQANTGDNAHFENDSALTAAVSADNGFGIAAGGELSRRNQKELDLYFRTLKDLGATWVRWDIDWQMVQPSGPEDYDWKATDRIAATAKRYGIRSLAILAYAPDWAVEGNCPSDKQCPPENADTFAAFAGAAANRYKDSVDAWEIWNEPNHLAYWYPEPHAGNYTELLKAAYVQIKKADPDSIVVSAGLTDMSNESGVSIAPYDYVTYMYEAGAKDYFDVLGLHPYTYPGYDYGWPQITSILEIMDNNGDSGKKIWITEYGAPTGGSGRAFEIGEAGYSYGKDFMSEEAQSSMAKSIFAFKAANSERIGNLFWYTLCDSSADKSTIENFFGIIRFDGSKKTVYNTIKNLISKL
jgi:GH35 family endo-1,4-beta-xylanase